MYPITSNDFLSAMFELRPVRVALIIWSTGWGSLLLVAWREDDIYEGLLRDPGHMIGDFFMLPIAGLLITQFYRGVVEARLVVMNQKITHVALLCSSFTTIGVTFYSVWISQNYQGVWSLPHTVFIWFFSYVLITFLIKGAIQLSRNSSPRMCATYTGVMLAMGIHLSLKPAIFGI